MDERHVVEDQPRRPEAHGSQVVARLQRARRRPPARRLGKGVCEPVERLQPGTVGRAPEDSRRGAVERRVSRACSAAKSFRVSIGVIAARQAGSSAASMSGHMISIRSGVSPLGSRRCDATRSRPATRAVGRVSRVPLSRRASSAMSEVRSEPRRPRRTGTTAGCERKGAPGVTTDA